MQFVNPWLLYLIWLVPVLALAWLMAYRRTTGALEKFMAAPMRAKLSPRRRPQRFYWQLALIAAGLCLAIIAAARPQWGTREEKVYQRGRDLMILLDVSRSMLAQDVHPNRLQRAKTDILDLLRELQGDRAGLIAFRSQAVQLCPLTTDYSYLEQVLNDVSIESAPRGATDLGAAILKGLESFRGDTGSHKALILISDGEDLAGTVKAAAEQSKKQGVIIFTVGFGSQQGAKIPGKTRKDGYLSYQGKEVITRLEHDTLKMIAATTSGLYVPVGVANVKLGNLYRDHLSKIAARDIEESLQRRYIDRYQWFLLPAIIFLLCAALLSRGRLAVRPKIRQDQDRTGTQAMPRKPGVKQVITTGIIMVCLTGISQAVETAKTDTARAIQPAATGTNFDSSHASVVPPGAAQPVSVSAGKAGARLAQQLYYQGRYKKAAEAYLQASHGDSLRLQNKMLFNAGCALYRAGLYQQATEKFEELTRREEADAASAFYNLGCTYYEIAQQLASSTSNEAVQAYPPLLEQSGRSFQRALSIKPDDSAARDNLATVANILPVAREQARIKALLKKYQGQKPYQIADEMLLNQRKIILGLNQTATNTTPAKIELLEDLSAEQRNNKDILIPLKTSMQASLAAPVAARTKKPAPSQQQVKQQQTRLNEHIEALRNGMEEARQQLRDLDGNAFHTTQSAEAGIYTVWKSIAPFQMLLREDMLRQTNSISLTTNAIATHAEKAIADIRAQQAETIRLTQLFTERFTQAVPPEGTAKQPRQAASPGTTPAQAVSNGEQAAEGQITAAIRTNILHLARQAELTQKQAAGFLADTNLVGSLTPQKRSYELLKAIQDLLPKDKKKDPQQKPQPKPKQQDQDQEPQPKPKQQDQDQKPQPKPKQQDQDPKPQPKPRQPQKGDMSPGQAQDLMDKALQREKEHKKEKEKRAPYIPMAPVDTDW